MQEKGESMSHTVHLDDHRKRKELDDGFKYLAMSIYQNASNKVQRVQALGELTSEYIRDILELNK